MTIFEDDYPAIVDRQEREIDRLRGEIESWKALVSKLESKKYREGYDNALAEQPFDRAAVIEECAVMAEKLQCNNARWIAIAIRALKDKP